MKKVIIYTLSSCIPSRLLKHFLRESGVVFEERDISDPKFYDEIVEKSGQGTTPVIDIDGRIIEGFDKDELKKALGLSLE